MNDTQIQLPKYKCTKEVFAAKIARHERSEDGVDLFLDFGSGNEDGSVHVTDAWFAKHEPAVGGYFVQYADGRSYSPAPSFEEGYTRIVTKASKSKDAE